MKVLKSPAHLFGVLFLSGQLSSGQSRLELEFRDEKNFLITGPEQFQYQGGEWIVEVIDGVFPLLPCADNFGQIYVRPYLLCPNGTTTLITQGDFDGDGVRDLGIYLSTEQPIPARSIQPFASELIELYAAPPSDLPRPIDAFQWVDQSVVGFFDLVEDPINGVGYRIAFYRSSRPYLPTEIERHRDEIVPGVYQFSFPGLGSTPSQPRTFFMSAAHREMVEAFPGPGGKTVQSGGIFVGNDFRLLNDDRWNNGAMEFDPRLGFDFDWEGFNTSTFLFGDELAIAVRDRATGLVRFPPVPFPEFNPDTRQIIGNSELGIPTGYDIGSNFFGPNESLVAELEFRRELVNGSSVDRSGRFFRWNIELIDTFDGFSTVNFPLGTPAGLRAPSFDFDGDGFTNLEEFGLQTDPTDPASVPNPTPILDPFTQQCLLDIPKRPAIGSSLTYLIQYSVDMENWITIEQGDPNWFIVFNDSDQISVLSRRPAGINPCFLRVRFQQN